MNLRTSTETSVMGELRKLLNGVRMRDTVISNKQEQQNAQQQKPNYHEEH